MVEFIDGLWRALEANGHGEDYALMLSPTLERQVLLLKDQQDGPWSHYWRNIYMTKQLKGFEFAIIPASQVDRFIVGTLPENADKLLGRFVP